MNNGNRKSNHKTISSQREYRIYKLCNLNTFWFRICILVEFSWSNESRSDTDGKESTGSRLLQQKCEICTIGVVWGCMSAQGVGIADDTMNAEKYCFI